MNCCEVNQPAGCNEGRECPVRNLDQFGRDNLFAVMRWLAEKGRNFNEAWDEALGIVSPEPANKEKPHA